MRISTMTLLGIFCLISTSPVGAGFFDKLIDRTADRVQKKVEDKIENKVDQEVDKVIEPGVAGAPPSGSGTEPPGVETENPEQGGAKAVAEADVEPGGGVHQTTSKDIAKAVVKLAPEIFELRPEDQVKDLLLCFFPEETEIKSNEFYWHKNKEALIARAIEMSKDAPTTFEVAPWVDNSIQDGTVHNPVNYFKVLFGRYDFDRRAFPVYPKKLEIPWLSGGNKYAAARYHFPGVKVPEENHWVPVDIDRAEAITNRIGGNFDLYGHYTFTIERVVGLKDITEHPEYEKYKDYIGVGGGHGQQTKENMVPYFDISIGDNKIDLYLPRKAVSKANTLIPRKELELFTTLELESAGG